MIWYIYVYSSETYSEQHKYLRQRFSGKTVNEYKPLTIFAKTLYLGCEYAYAIYVMCYILCYGSF